MGICVSPTALPTQEFWRDKRVLVTGHTGFKGSWLSCWLRLLGADVLGVSLPEPVSEPSLWDQLQLDGIEEVREDIVAGTSWTDSAQRFSPHVVMHLAAQPLVSRGWAEPATTFAVNVQGTVRVLELAQKLPDLLATLIVTTDKVYDPSQPPPYDEQAPLGGRDPYSASKAAAELVVQAWPTGAPCGTARAGNVIGGGDWAADRLLPDLVRGWTAGTTVSLRRPDAVRPWQHVLEPLRGYLLYTQALAEGARAPRHGVNFGPTDAQSVPVRAVVECAAEEWHRLGRRLPETPWIDVDAPAFAETDVLTLDSRLARESLDWVGALDWDESVRLTLEWHVATADGEPAAEVVQRQLASYIAKVHGACA